MDFSNTILMKDQQTKGGFPIEIKTDPFYKIKKTTYHEISYFGFNFNRKSTIHYRHYRTIL